ncbi:MAG: hypothetical protein PHR53_01915 [Bacteroidales bacterium]|nr:hypothetical protein [Bacteroidales bacterium]
MKNHSLQHVKSSVLYSNGVKWLLLILVTCFTLGTFSSCNSKKKMAANDLEARLEKAKQQLTAIMEDDGNMSIEEMESQLGAIKKQDFDNPYVKKLQPKVQEVKSLMAQVEKKIANAKQQQIDNLNARITSLINDNNKTVEDLESELADIKDVAKKYSNSETQNLIQKLEEKIKNMKAQAKVDETIDIQFDKIVSLAQKNDINGANAEIQKVLSQFENPQTPVLIIVAIEGTIIDYDKPTTIEAYLNYLKDQKVNRNAIKEIEKNALGKIKLLTLIKK